MSTRTSPVRDRRVIVLAAEVAETRDRKIPGVLLGLKCKVLFFFLWVGNWTKASLFPSSSRKVCDPEQIY